METFWRPIRRDALHPVSCHDAAMTDHRDTRYKEFLALIKEEVGTGKERSLEAYRILFPALGLEVDKTYRMLKADLPPQRSLSLMGPLRWLRRNPIKVLLVLALVAGGIMAMRSVLADQQLQSNFVAAIYKSFSDKAPTRKQQKILRALVPEGLHGALDLNPLDTETLDGILEELDAHEQPPTGAIRLLHPRAVISPEELSFRWIQPVLPLPLKLTLRDNTEEPEFERHFPLPYQAPESLAVFLLPEEAIPPPGEYAWGVTVDLERITDDEERRGAEALVPPCSSWRSSWRASRSSTHYRR